MKMKIHVLLAAVFAVFVLGKNVLQVRSLIIEFELIKVDYEMQQQHRDAIIRSLIRIELAG
jgi:hypothetical protein